MKIQATAWLICFALLMLGSTTVTADHYLSLRAGFLTGDFGGDLTNQQQSLTATLGYSGRQFDGSISGQFFRTSYDGVEEDGLGDLYLSGGMLILDEYQSPVDLYASVTVKLPTADETQGLGSSEADYGFYLSIARYFSNTKWDLHGGYTLLGDPDGIDYENQQYIGIGLLKSLGSYGYTASLEYANNIVDTTSDDAIAELHASLFRWLDRENMLRVSGFKGFTAGGTDYGVALEWLHRL